MPRLALCFHGHAVPADIECPPELLALLASFGVATAAPDDAATDAIVLRCADGRFQVSGPAYLSPFSVAGLDAAAGSVMAGLAACRALALDEHMLCIHGAAAAIGGRGYLFLAPFGTGKSSLMTELAVLGADILADDVVLLNLRDGSMAGLPIAPRLRQAYLDKASAPIRNWIAERRIFAGPRYTYLSPGILASAPVALTDIVLLNRVDGAAHEPVLEPASPGALIPRLLWHNMSRHHAPSAIARMASALATNARGSILHAGSFAAAAGRLASGSIGSVPGAGPLAPASTRRDGLDIMRTDRGAIVSDDQTGRIFEINESAFVILTLLQEAGNLPEVRILLRDLYPDVAGDELDRQLSDCLRQFAGLGLADLPDSLMAGADQ